MNEESEVANIPVQQARTTGPYNRWSERQRTPQPVWGESRVDDSFGNDTDVNKIVERFARTGYLPEGSPSVQPVYQDVTNVQEDLTVLLAKTNDARKELENIQKQAQAAKAQQAAKDAEDLARYREQEKQSLVQPEASADPA